MKQRPPDSSSEPPAAQMSDVLILPDGKVLVHSLTPAFTRLLRELNVDDPRLGEADGKAGQTGSLLCRSAVGGARADSQRRRQITNGQ